MYLSKPEMVLLDLDGTLVDSVPDLAYCVDSMLKEVDLPPRNIAKVRQWMGRGLERLVKRALVDGGQLEPDNAPFDKAFPILLKLYAQNTCERSRLYPGAREGLAYLRRSAYKVSCVTNKLTRFTKPLLQSLGIYHDFSIVICGDILAKKKPDPMPLLHAAEFFGVEPGNALMVGDTVNDIRAARAVGFQILCVTYGYNQGGNIHDARPDATVDPLAKLPSLI
ncbi:MAG: phosphoglycolate phosphatase [Gammaproteobacteria bacterium]|nr:phosphoglycolate phosphatase [Gammaproteobacteria bacterium]MCI0590983.1 phosphoglycolate phosphatase [Gammaproteobacteria bacterium]